MKSKKHNTLKSGTVVKLDGFPLRLKHNVRVYGFLPPTDKQKVK